MNRLEKMEFRARMEDEGGEVGSVFISGPITNWAWSDYNETDSLMVRRELEKVKDAKRLDIYIDSPGGYLDEGMTMMRLIAEHGAAEKHAYCMECASAATLLCIPCTQVTAYEGAEFLFHMPRAAVSGTPEEIIGYGEGLKKRAQSVAGLYAKRMSGKSVEDITQMMRDETWMNPEEALACGFVDDVRPIAPGNGVITMRAGRSDEDERELARLLGYRPRAHRAAMAAHMGNPQTSADFEGAGAAYAGNPQTSADLKKGRDARTDGAHCDKSKEGKTRMTLEELKASEPELVESIMQAGRDEGAKAERERLMALDELATEETAEIIAEAKYGEKPMTAPEAAMAILTAQRKDGQEKKAKAESKAQGYLSARRKETEGMSRVLSGAASDNDAGAEDEAEINAFAAEMAKQQRRF